MFVPTGIMFLQLCRVTRSINKADDCGSQAMARKKQIKLEEEAISEILVADTASKSGAKVSNVRRLF